MRSAAPLQGCSSRGVICSNGRPQRRRRSDSGSISPASIAGWLPRSSSRALSCLFRWLRARGRGRSRCRSRCSGRRHPRSRVGSANRLPSPVGSTMSDNDATALRLTARRTWRFFETFITPADNMLPPDNFQEDPAAVAHRTSPDQYGALSPVHGERPRFRLDRNPVRPSNGSSRRCRPWADLRGFAAISTTGMTLRICARLIRPTYRRSTAAIWRDI